MKNVFKYISLIISGIFSSIIFYPLLHEAGHLIAALIAGAKIEDFSIFPTPYIMCEITNVGNRGLQLISVSGIFFPFLVVMVLKPKHFWFWYNTFLIEFICMISFVVSIFSIILSFFGVDLKKNDTVLLLSFSNGRGGGLLIIALLSVVLIIISFKKQKLLDKIINYFY